MKTNIILSGLLAIVLSSCYYPEFLPPPEDIGINPYGSYIMILHKTTRNIEGEFIALDSSGIIVLDESSNSCITVPVADIHSFKIRYAKSPNYAWTIPFALVVPIINGWYSLLTLPMHLIVTIAVSSDSHNAFVYENKFMSYEELRMFARFPQGVPAFINLADIHR